MRSRLACCPFQAGLRNFALSFVAYKQIKVLRGLDESLARFYVGSIVLALEYLHEHSIGAGQRGSKANKGT